MERRRLLNMADLSACPRRFDALGPGAEAVSLPPSPETLLERIPEFDIYFASLHVRMSREALDRAARPRVIATASTGLDHIDVLLAGRPYSQVAVWWLKNLMPQ